MVQQATHFTSIVCIFCVDLFFSEVKRETGLEGDQMKLDKKMLLRRKVQYKKLVLMPPYDFSTLVIHSRWPKGCITYV